MFYIEGEIKELTVSCDTTNKLSLKFKPTTQFVVKSDDKECWMFLNGADVTKSKIRQEMSEFTFDPQMTDLRSYANLLLQAKNCHNKVRIYVDSVESATISRIIFL